MNKNLSYDNCQEIILNHCNQSTKELFADPFKRFPDERIKNMILSEIKTEADFWRNRNNETYNKLTDCYESIKNN